MASKDELEQQVLLLAAEYGISVVFFRNAMGRKLGLNITDSECLSYLGIKGAATPGDLARYTGLTTGSTSAMLDRLERGGFITRRQNPDDRRSTLIEINADAAVGRPTLVEGVQAAHRELVASFSPDELAIIADFLSRLTRNVTDHTQAIDEDGRT